MWEQILKVYNLKVDRFGEGRARATYQWNTETLILALQKLIKDYDPKKIEINVEEGFQNPTPVSEFKLNDRKFLEYLTDADPNIIQRIAMRQGVDKEIAEGALITANRNHLRYIFDNNPEIETEEQMQDLYATLAHEGTHFGQFRFEDIRDIKGKISAKIDALVETLNDIGLKKVLLSLGGQEYDIPNDVFNLMSKVLAEMAYDATLFETQPAILDGYDTKRKLKARILNDYVNPLMDRIMETYVNSFETMPLTASDRVGIAKLKSFAENEVPNKIKQYINDKVILKSWEAVIGFDDINKKSKARRKKHSKRQKKKKRRKKRSGDNFKREKDEGLHGWFSRRGGKQKKGGKTQRGWIACGTCGQKGGPKPCGRKDASKGRKRRCRPTCAACKTYKRRKGSP